MRLEVLLATMNQKDDSILREMRIGTDIIVCNQNAATTSYDKYEYDGHTVNWYNFQEKGVGLNRNNALFRSSADVCLLADDDLMYDDTYEQTILDAFRRYADVDVILFNIKDANGRLRSNKKNVIRVHRYNCGRYGAVRIAFRRLSVIKNSVCFNQLFGGGAMFTAGEDTMFIRDCIRRGLKVVAVPECILQLVNKRPSTWFDGYNQKFFEDFGSSYYVHYGELAIVCTLLQLIRRRNKWLTQFSVWEAWKFSRNGIKSFKLLR